MKTPKRQSSSRIIVLLSAAALIVLISNLNALALRWGTKKSGLPRPRHGDATDVFRVIGHSHSQRCKQPLALFDRLLLNDSATTTPLKGGPVMDVVVVALLQHWTSCEELRRFVSEGTMSMKRSGLDVKALAFRFAYPGTMYTQRCTFAAGSSVEMVAIGSGESVDGGSLAVEGMAVAFKTTASHAVVVTVAKSTDANSLYSAAASLFSESDLHLGSCVVQHPGESRSSSMRKAKPNGMENMDAPIAAKREHEDEAEDEIGRFAGGQLSVGGGFETGKASTGLFVDPADVSSGGFRVPSGKCFVLSREVHDRFAQHDGKKKKSLTAVAVALAAAANYQLAVCPALEMRIASEPPSLKIGAPSRLPSGMDLFVKRLRVAWFSLCCYCCGFSNEIVHYVVPLRKRYQVSLITDPGCMCSGFQDSVERAINRSAISLSQFNASALERGRPLLWISHTTPLHYSGVHRVAKDRGAYVVGRTMFEFDRVPRVWLNHTHLVDEIWVPSQFVYNAFADTGLPKSVLQIVPEAIDTALFSPAEEVVDGVFVRNPQREIFRLPPTEDELFGACNGRPEFFASNVEDVNSVVGNMKFVSVFKWELRKGWDVLIEAYLKAFKLGDRVSLYVVTSIFTTDDKFEHRRDADSVLRMLLGYAEKKGLDANKAPHVFVITAKLGEQELAALFRSADAFVLPTRGEGWGLPAMQAMATGLPTISTRYGGSLAFMDSHVAYLINIDGTETVPKNVGVESADDSMKWAKPSVSHTAKLMRHVFDHREEAAIIGSRARRRMWERFSEEAVFLREIGPRMRRIEDHLRNRIP